MSKAEVAYREAVRAIESQEAAIAELRSRTGVAFAATALSVSVLGSVAFEGSWSVAEWVGVTMIGCMVVAVAVIVWPRPWQLNVSGKTIVRDWVDAEDAETVEDLYRDLAIHLSDSYEANQSTLDELHRVYALAVALALGSIVAFALALL